MNKEEINLAISKVTGNTCCSCPACQENLTNYAEDLNAMHEAICSSELHTNLGLGFSYLSLLAEIVGGKPDFQCMALIQASAAQRAEAFLKTLNLWKNNEQ